MKLSFLLIIAIFLCIGCSNQTQDGQTAQDGGEAAEYLVNAEALKEKFSTDIANYLTAVNEKDWDKAMDMVYPGLFEIVPKDQMVQVFAGMEEMGIEMKADIPEIEKISEVIQHEDLQYCRVYYKGNLTIKISGQMLLMKDELKASFMELYGSESFKTSEDDTVFDVLATKSMMAIADKGSDDWTYLEYKDEQEQIFKQLIPEEVFAQLKDNAKN